MITFKVCIIDVLCIGKHYFKSFIDLEQGRIKLDIAGCII